MAIRNDSRSGRVRGPQAANQPRTHPNSRPVAHTRPRGGPRHLKSRPTPEAVLGRPARRKPPSGVGTGAVVTLREVVEQAIQEERGSLITAIAVLYALHNVLRRDMKGDHSDDDEAVEDAAKWADPTVLTSMLLVRLHRVVNNLERVGDRNGDVELEEVALTENAGEPRNGGAP